MKRTILFDFDRTLLDTDALKIAQAKKIAEITELSIEQVHDGMRSYIASLASNVDFTAEGYAQYLQLLWGINPSDVLKIYITGANYIRDYLYEDALFVLKELSVRFRLGIFSEAQLHHQRLKIENSGVLEFIDANLLIIATRKKEMQLLQSIMQDTIIVDDDKEVIKSLKGTAPHLNPIWINRKDQEQFSDVTTIFSLSDLLTLNLLN